MLDGFDSPPAELDGGVRELAAGRAFNPQAYQQAAAALSGERVGAADRDLPRRSSTTPYAASHARHWPLPPRGQRPA